jgi:hypothetical protein
MAKPSISIKNVRASTPGTVLETRKAAGSAKAFAAASQIHLLSGFLHQLQMGSTALAMGQTPNHCWSVGNRSL